MPIENATTIAQLNPSWPLLSDTVESLGPQINMLKSVLQTCFPNLSAPLTTSPSAIALAAAAFNNGVLTVPAPTTGSATLVLTGSATTGSTVYLEAGAAASTGFALMSQAPTPTGGTAPAPVPELVSDGTGDVIILKSLTTPMVTATGNITAGGTIAGATINATGSIEQAGAALLPHGIITLWHGTAANIPAGWYLCDGTNGTPDLRNSFVIGAGAAYAPGSTGGSATVTLNTGNLPSHSHSVGDPGHTHGVIDPGHNHAITDPGHNHTVIDPGHQHALGGISNSNLNTGSGPFAVTGSGSSVATATAGTGISISSNHTGISVNSVGTGINNAASTTNITIGNTGSGTAFGILPPYYALCYIMKA